MKQKRGQGEWSFSQRKDGTWTARKQFGKKMDGKPNIKAFYGKTITEVRKKSREYEMLLATNSTDEKNKTTLYEYLSDWLRMYKSVSVKNTTYDGIEDAIEIRVKPFNIANVQLCNITTPLCQNYINELTSCGKKYSLATITKTYNIVNSCLQHATDIGDIPRNPMALVKLPSGDKVQTKEKDTRFFTQEQMKIIVEQAQKKFSNGKPIYYYGNLIVALMYTGMRVGELLGLRWEDIDFENNTIIIDNTVATVTNRDKKSAKKTMVTDTSAKTKKSSRKIPMSQKARDSFMQFKSNLKCTVTDKSYVALSKNGELTNARNLRRCLDSILEESGLKEKSINEGYGLHCLRHTFVSTLLAKGVDIKIISELVGHEKVSTTYNIYAHLIPTQKENSVKLLDDI